MCSVSDPIIFPGINFSKGTGRNIAIIPPHKYSGIAFRDFDLANAEHRREMWMGRVELLFSATFKNSGGRILIVILPL